MKVKDFISEVSVLAGKQNEKAIVDILARQDLENIEIEDSVATSIFKNIMNIEGAKNNPLVKSHYNALTLGTMDSEILNAIRKLELGEDFETELSANKNTFDKFRKLSEKLKESFDNLKAAQGKGDDKTIEKYTKQINDLNAKYAQLKETTVSKTDYDKLQQDRENDVRDFMVHTFVKGLNFANKDVKPEINTMLAKTILDNELATRKAIIVKDGNNLKLKRSDDPALDYFDDTNKPVSFEDFTSKAFADAKILAVSGNNPNTPPAPPVNTFIPGQQGQFNTSKFDAAMAEAESGEFTN